MESCAIEHLKSNTLGTYRPNSLFINISSLCDLNPDEGEVTPMMIAVNVHEYIHYLHNVSTAAGQTYLLHSLLFVRYLASRCDDSGHYIGGDENDEIVKVINDINQTIYTYLGDVKINNIDGYDNISDWEFSCLTKEENNNGSPYAVSELTVKNGSEVLVKEKVIIGFNFITEGIAYLIEREIRLLNGDSKYFVDDKVPIYPYLSYEIALQKWTNRNLDTIDLIKIGISSLSSSFSGDMLRIICEALHNNPDLDLDFILKKAREQCTDMSNLVIYNIINNLNDFSSNEYIGVAIDEYKKMAFLGTELRNENWLIEDVFIDRYIDQNKFYDIVNTMIDCNVLQEKPNGQLEVYWLGPKKIAKNENEIRSVSLLQSILHFSLLHMKKSGVTARTEELKNIKCPFSGGCKSEELNNYPQNCKDKPWMNFLNHEEGKSVCCYAAAVKSLRK